MEIEILAKQDWVYSVERRGDKYFVSVVCGGAGLFETDVEVSRAKAEEMAKDNSIALQMAESIRSSPEKYVTR